MPGSVTNKQQVLPVPAGTEVPAASTAGTGDPGLDGTTAPYTYLLDANNPAAKVPLATLAQDGADSTDSHATQAAAGVGVRGWLSTLVSLLRAGTAKVALVDATQAPISSTNPLPVGGAVSVGNTTASPVPISGTVSVSTSTSTPLYVNPPTPAPVTPAAAALSAGQDNTVTLAQTCRTYFIQNNTAAALHFTIDGSAAGLGSPSIAAGGYVSDDMIVSAVHLYPEGTGSVALNTTATPGVWVQGGA